MKLHSLGSMGQSCLAYLLSSQLAYDLELIFNIVLYYMQRRRPTVDNSFLKLQNLPQFHKLRCLYGSS
ncbi:hypothetical protein L6452_17077 [Arctium lappa]|uniref:Uncharacterized protein n=1 Tax=Arctium lappa TaxID=4217 RepID=A0ACB9C2I6_ARCLA|nr:hypothetical protein L6452_17077 [Arctium lappa]